MTGKLFVSPTVLAPLGVLALLLAVLVIVGKVPIRYNVRNLLVRWPVTLLTAVAFTLVVGLMTFMLAFVNGMYQLTLNSGQPGNVIVLADGATDEAFSRLDLGEISKIEQHPAVLHDEEDRPLASWEIYLVVNQPIPNTPQEPVSSGRRVRQRRFLQMRGLKDPVRTGKVHNLPLHPGGSWFSSAGVQDVPGGSEKEPAIQAVLGEGIARELGPDQGKRSLEVGDLFEVGGRKWIVVGILESAGSTFDSEIWAKAQVIGEKFGKRDYYSTVVLRTADAAAARETAADLSANFKNPAVAAQTETDYYERLSTTNRQFLAAALFVAIVMAIGGVFGIMNTMFAAVSQRSADIGVLRILGFARWQVLASFFLESLALAVVGGVLGCLLGSLCDGWSASSIISSGQGGGKSVVLRMVVDANILLGGLLFSLLMGCLGGLLPALSTMRIRPLEAVR